VIDKNAIWIGRPVFHVPARSNFVFTQAIARIKGSDASNLHDEEVGEDQMEFSDDEAEAQWRRNRSAAHVLNAFPNSPLPHEPDLFYRKEAKREQASSFNYVPPLETTPRQPKMELPTVLAYPAADDGDVPYSALPYDDAPDPRPVPAAYDPYSDHEEEAKPPFPLPPRPQPPSPRQNRSGNESGGSRGRGKERGRGRGGLNQNQNRRERKNTGPGERGRPNRGRGGRGRGGSARQNQSHGQNGFFPEQRPRELSPTSLAIAHATGQYSSVSYSHDEGYSPVNANNGFFDPASPTAGTIPHINPRFFAGDTGAADMSAGFSMPWGEMSNMAGYGYGYNQPGYGYGGYGQGGDEMGYNNQGYGWPSGEQSYSSHGQYDQSQVPRRDSHDGT
jgi:H/ACA ribonucleoprotein complex non-core subunit NAF1